MTTEITNCNVLQLTESWYTQLVEDCKDIVVETEFVSRWSLVEGYHSLGKRILEEYDNFQRVRMADSELIKSVAISIGRRDRTVYYAIQFARMYPDLNLLKEGKNISWHHIINKYLTDGSEKPVVKKADLAAMIKRIKQLLEHQYLEAHQNLISGDSDGEIICNFIRYLQDQVEKITNGQI